VIDPKQPYDLIDALASVTVLGSASAGAWRWLGFRSRRKRANTADVKSGANWPRSLDAVTNQ
jgi:hypothetical protein